MELSLGYGHSGTQQSFPIYESSGQSSSSKSMESVGGVHSQEETSHWQFNFKQVPGYLIPSLWTLQ